jgi:hypothetical protein
LKSRTVSLHHNGLLLWLWVWFDTEPTVINQQMDQFCATCQDIDHNLKTPNTLQPCIQLPQSRRSHASGHGLHHSAPLGSQGNRRNKQGSSL